MQGNTIDTTLISISTLGIFTYLWIDAEIFFLYTILLFIDFFLWSVKAFSLEKFTSRRAINGFAGKVVLLLVILSVWVCGKVVDFPIQHFLSFMFTALALTELYSIIENAYQIRTGKELKNWDGVGKIMGIALKIIRKKVENMEDNFNDRDNGKK